MYMLRAISGVLHQDVGPAVPDSALDLRVGELAVVVPLVVCLLGLSAYPNLISGHAFGGGQAIVQKYSTSSAFPAGDWTCFRPSGATDCITQGRVKLTRTSGINIDAFAVLR
jgi:hypothetical protein